MQKFWEWLIVSSADPDKVALTIKGFLSGFIPLAIMIARMLGYALSDQTLEEAVLYATAGISAGLTLVGLVRKIYLTFKPSAK